MAQRGFSPPVLPPQRDAAHLVKRRIGVDAPGHNGRADRVIQGAHGLYNYLQAVQGYLAPPVFVVFFLGVFWKRMNWQGCLWAMIVGFAVLPYLTIVPASWLIGRVQELSTAEFVAAVLGLIQDADVGVKCTW